MTNIDRWKSFLNTKRIKFTEHNTKFGTRLYVKLKYKKYGINVFISENRLNVHPFTVSFMGKGNKCTYNKQGFFGLKFRKGALNCYYTRLRDRKFENLGHKLTGLVFPHGLTDGSRKKHKDFTNCLMYRRYRQIVTFFIQLHGHRAYQKIGNTIMCACYPALNNFEKKHELPVIGATRYFKNPDFTEKDWYKILVKHNSKLLKKNFHQIDAPLYYIFRGRMNRGQAEKLINESSNITTDANFVGIRRLLNNYSLDRALKILLSEGSRSWYLKDTVDMYNNYEGIILPEKPKDLKELHDEVARQQRRLKTKKYNFKINDKLKKIDGTIVDGMKIVVPKDNHELIDWGTKLNNCISGYDISFNKGYTTLLGVEKNNEIIYNIEIRGGRIIQFMADRNRYAGKEVVDKFLPIFKKHKLIAGANNGTGIFQ